MFHATMRSAIEEARTLAQLDSLSRTIWQAHAAETVTDAEAQELCRDATHPPEARSARPWCPSAFHSAV